MNKLIREQLNKCRVARIPIISDTDTDILIEKSSVNELTNTLMLNCSYLLQFNPDYIGSERETLCANMWNSGVHLQDTCIKATVTEFRMGMIKIDAVAHNLNTNTDINRVYLAYWVDTKEIINIDTIG